MEKNETVSTLKCEGDPPCPGDGLPYEARPRSLFLGQILVEEGLLSDENLRALIARQRALPPEERLPVGRLAVAGGLITEAELLAVLDRLGWRLHLGELLATRGRLRLADLTAAMQEQNRTGEMLGQVLLRMGLCDERTLAEGLAEQCGVAFIPIAHVPAGGDLVRWINPAFARAHGVVPVVRRGRTLTVAAWEPRALALAADIEQATGLTVDVVLTTRAEVEERIRQVYSPQPASVGQGS